MPLNVQFLRDDTPRTMPHGFGPWHLGVALAIGSIEQARLDHVSLPDPEVMSMSLADMDEAQRAEFDRQSRLGWKAYNHGKCIVTKPISFTDPSDGEVLDLEPGDEIHMWR